MFELNLPVFEVVTIIFFYYFFKWFFRGGVVFLFIKVLSQLKEKGKGSLKEFEKSLKGEGEN